MSYSAAWFNGRHFHANGMRILVRWLCIMFFSVALVGGVSVHANQQQLSCAVHCADASSSVADILPDSDCCIVSETSNHTSQPCNADMSCSAPGMMEVFDLRFAWAREPDRLPVLHAQLLPFDPSGVWRPPLIS